MKKFLEKMCTKIPSSLEGECEEFVNIYGDAVMAVSVQGIDPSQVNIFLINVESVNCNLFCVIIQDLSYAQYMPIRSIIKCMG